MESLNCIPCMRGDASSCFSPPLPPPIPLFLPSVLLCLPSISRSPHPCDHTSSGHSPCAAPVPLCAAMTSQLAPSSSLLVMPTIWEWLRSNLVRKPAYSPGENLLHLILLMRVSSGNIVLPLGQGAAGRQCTQGLRAVAMALQCGDSQDGVLCGRNSVGVLSPVVFPTWNVAFGCCLLELGGPGCVCTREAVPRTLAHLCHDSSCSSWPFFSGRQRTEKVAMKQLFPPCKQEPPILASGLCSGHPHFACFLQRSRISCCLRSAKCSPICLPSAPVLPLLRPAVLGHSVIGKPAQLAPLCAVVFPSACIHRSITILYGAQLLTRLYRPLDSELAEGRGVGMDPRPCCVPVTC